MKPSTDQKLLNAPELKDHGALNATERPLEVKVAKSPSAFWTWASFQDKTVVAVVTVVESSVTPPLKVILPLIGFANEVAVRPTATSNALAILNNELFINWIGY